MSLDYPFYQELKRRSHPAAKWWRVGDIVYYAGLLPAIGSFMFVYERIMGALFGQYSWWSPIWPAGFFAFFVAIFFVGVFLKRTSYIMAEEDGIHVDDF